MLQLTEIKVLIEGNGKRTTAHMVLPDGTKLLLAEIDSMIPVKAPAAFGKFTQWVQEAAMEVFAAAAQEAGMGFIPITKGVSELQKAIAATRKAKAALN